MISAASIGTADFAAESKNVDRYGTGCIVVNQFGVVLLVAKFDEATAMRPFAGVCMFMA